MKKHPLFTIMSILAILAYLTTPVSAAPLVREVTVQTEQTQVKADEGPGIDSLQGSTVNSITPTNMPDGGTTNICFNATFDSPDVEIEYVDRFDFDLPDTWTVNSVEEVPGTGCGLGHTTGVEAGNVVYWQTNGYPPETGCGDWTPGTYDFCANVTVPDCTGAPYNLEWNIYGDGFPDPLNPGYETGTIAATCGSLPGSLEGTVYDGDSQPIVKGAEPEDISGSYLTLDSTAGAGCFIPGSADEYCFTARTLTTDGEYINDLFVKFPMDWTVTDAYLSGTPTCSNGGTYGEFLWDLPMGNNYELHIDHFRMMSEAGDDCVATYCVAATPGTTGVNAQASWYYAGDQYNVGPHQVCSNDGYTPNGYPACEEAVEPPAAVPLCGAEAPCTAATVTVNPGNISLPVDPTTGHYGPIALDAGVYTVSATASGYSTAVEDVTVNPGLTTIKDFILFRPVADITPGSITLTSVPDNPIVVPLTIANLGHVALNWDIVELPNLTWVTTSEVSGVTDPTSTTTVDVTVTCTPDQAGTVLNGVLQVNHDEPCLGPVEIPVQLTCVAPTPPEVNVTPGSLSASLAVGATSVQQLEIQNLAAGVLNWSILEHNIAGDVAGVNAPPPPECEPADIPWASVNPLSGVTQANSSSFAAVTFDAAGLAVGSYTGNVCVQSNDPDEEYTVVPLSLTVLAGQEIDITPLAVTSTQWPDQTVAQPLEICNLGDLPLTWSVYEVAQAGPLGGVVVPVPDGSPAPQGSIMAGRTVNPRPETITIEPQAGIEASPNILLLAAGPAASIEAFLEAYGDLGMVDVFDAENGTPTLVLLQGYEAVVAWSDFPFLDPIGIGNVLADYVDGGGKVINLNFSMGIHGWNMDGRFISQNYTALNGVDIYNVASCLGTYTPGHPIMAGVTTVCDDGRIDATTLTPNSTTVASWADGEIFVAVKDTLPVVSINAYIGDYYNWTGQMVDVVHNAIRWLTMPTVDIPWLSEVPASGTVPANDCTIIDVEFDSTGMALGEYTAGLLVESNDVDEHWTTLPVTMTLVEPDIAVDPLAIGATLEVGQTSGATFTITNNGTDDLTFNLNAAPTWLSLTPTSGTIAPAGTQVINATFDSTGLTGGVYTHDIVVSSNDPDEPTITVVATLTVNAAEIVVTAPALDADLCPAATQVFTATICNEGNIDLTWSITEIPAADWLAAVPASGTVVPAGCVDVNITFNTTGLAAGDYSSTLEVSSNDPYVPVVNLPATLTVLQPAEILGVTYTITNLQVEFNANAVGTLPLTFDWDFGDGDTSALEDPTHVYPEGGPYTPTLTVSNMCGIDTWTGSFTLCDPAAGADFTWMPADPMLGETIYFTASLVSGDPPYSFAWDWGDGTTDSGRYAQHTYAEGGEYLVNLTVTNACGVATASHTVTVMGPEILVSPVAITVTVPAGQTGSGFVTISNTGSSDLHITDIDGLQPWLSIPFTQTVIAAGASTELTFTFNAAGLPAASYQSTVMIHSDSPTQPVVEVIVTMMISEYVLYLPLVMKAP